MLLPQKQEKSQTNCWDLGITSLICRSAWPAARQALQVEITTTANTDLGLVTLQLWGENQIETLLTEEGILLCTLLKNPPQNAVGLT